MCSDSFTFSNLKYILWIGQLHNNNKLVNLVYNNSVCKCV